ncbi:Cupin domain containing protein, possibly involved in glyoxylate utilization [Methylacidimicrobium sp. AP8]|nr:Cupin domain containing protein, possibly involved in glyoxylate utilization [Methylacidimicrobium sp. AP8]
MPSEECTPDLWHAKTGSRRKTILRHAGEPAWRHESCYWLARDVRAGTVRKEFIAGRPSPPGSTRTVLGLRHALLDPVGHVRGGVPGFAPEAAVVLISPRLGAGFVQFLVDLRPGEAGGSGLPGVEGFLYLLAGEAAAELGGQPVLLAAGDFFFTPPGMAWRLRAGACGARAVVFEKPYARRPGISEPPLLVGRTGEVAGLPFLGDPDALLRTFLPEDPSFDMAVNLFEFRPGASLPFVEAHVMEHGLLMLEGRGIYRLEDAWYPVAAGDAIWMAPYCPQWFAALGPTPARYLYYKDVGRHPLEDGRGEGKIA